MINKDKIIRGFVITTFVVLYLIVSVISTIHVIDFFRLSNPEWLAISLALAFEVGAAASLASLVVLHKMNKFIVWSLFIILTLVQAMGNTYYAYSHLENFSNWIELFGLVDEDVIYQKRILSIISGAILPLVSLGFIKSLVDYIKPVDVIDDLETIVGENDSIVIDNDIDNDNNIDGDTENEFEEVLEDNIVNNGYFQSLRDVVYTETPQDDPTRLR